MKLLSVTAGLIIIALTVAVNAQNSTALKDLQNKFYSINTLSADFVQTSRLSLKDKSLSLKGKFYYQKENRYRIEFRNSEIISDGSTVWNFNKNTKKVIINDLNSHDASAFSLRTILIDYPAKSTVETLPKEVISGNKYNVIRLNSKGGQGFKSIKVWSDDNSIIRQVEITDNAGTQHIFELLNIKINPELSGSKFSFEPPKGSEVIDLR
ncbi:MAG: LolA family protein [Ignavibacteriales bacterium]